MQTFEIADFDAWAVAWIGLTIVVLAIIAGTVISILVRHLAPFGLGFIVAWIAFLLGVYLPLAFASMAHDESEFKAGLESLDYSNVTVDSEGDFTAADGDGQYVSGKLVNIEENTYGVVIFPTPK